jgi:tRNA U34 5-carboxymethylaminomethyl modifying GTPase MnmE/TrmE
MIKVLTNQLIIYRELKFPPARSQATTLLSHIQKHLSDNRRGEVVRSGIKMAIFGPPNAGKSSLFNFLGNRIFLQFTKN